MWTGRACLQLPGRLKKRHSRHTHSQGPTTTLVWAVWPTFWFDLSQNVAVPENPKTLTPSGSNHLGSFHIALVGNMQTPRTYSNSPPRFSLHCRKGANSFYEFCRFPFLCRKPNRKVKKLPQITDLLRTCSKCWTGSSASEIEKETSSCNSSTKVGTIESKKDIPRRWGPAFHGRNITTRCKMDISKCGLNGKFQPIASAIEMGVADGKKM